MESTLKKLKLEMKMNDGKIDIKDPKMSYQELEQLIDEISTRTEETRDAEDQPNETTNREQTIEEINKSN